MLKLGVARIGELPRINGRYINISSAVGLGCNYLQLCSIFYWYW
jgi:hypothetical protein